MRTRSLQMLALPVVAGGLLALSLGNAGADTPITTPSGTYRAGPATTTANVQPEVRAGNVNSCSDIGTFSREFNVLDGGWFEQPEITVSVDNGYVRIYDNTGVSFSWESNLDIDVVLVKASDAYDSFSYDGGVRVDTGLHGPERYLEQLDRWQVVNISHVLFCTNGVLDVDDALPPVVVNDVSGTYDSTYPWAVAKSTGATQPIRQPVDTTAGVDYEVRYTRGEPTYSNGLVTGMALVTNPNAESISLSDMTASLSDGTACTVLDPPAILPPGNTDVVYTCEITTLPPPTDLLHLVTVTWPDQTLGSGTFLAAGTATYAEGSIEFTNNEIDECVTVSDSNTGTTVTGSICDTTTFTYSRSIPVQAGCSDTDNTADFTTNDTGTTDSSSITVTICGTQDLVVTKSGEPSFVRSYSWGVEKRADTERQSTAGDAQVTWTVDVIRGEGIDGDFTVAGNISVYNPNDFDISDVDVSDTAAGGNCLVIEALDIAIPAYSTAVLAYSCSFPDNPGTGTNMATASWDGAEYATANSSASGTADFEFGEPTTVVNGSITVSDSDGHEWMFGTTGSVSYTSTYTDPAGTCTEHSNTATIEETGQISEATTTVCVGADITVTKTATPSYTRTYAWDISKSVKPSIVKKIGGTAEFDYTVAGWQTGYSDSGWTVDGEVTVTNPNDWQAVDVTLTDSLPGCAFERPSVTVPASDSVTVSYACPLSSATDGTNTVTAIWAAAEHSTPNSSARADTLYDFGEPTNLTNSTMTFTDTFNGVSSPLGTLNAVDVGPYVSATYLYSRTVTVPTWDCTTYDNTARIVETGQSASTTVTVCGAAHTRALTMGYWQNKNGQSIVTTYCAGTAGTSLTSFLAQYNPFKNLTATSCKDAAAYVLGVIKSANASGASMNAMLKGQMLATALDVYFSSPSLGGNRIGAAEPIGGIAVDLTSVCKNISGGCTVMENTSAAFGGAASMTIDGLLALAASQSNSGGSVWYSNSKAVQALAKDMFDAINNQRAFGA